MTSCKDYPVHTIVQASPGRPGCVASPAAFSCGWAGERACLLRVFCEDNGVVLAGQGAEWKRGPWHPYPPSAGEANGQNLGRLCLGRLTSSSSSACTSLAHSLCSGAAVHPFLLFISGSPLNSYSAACSAPACRQSSAFSCGWAGGGPRGRGAPGFPTRLGWRGASGKRGPWFPYPVGLAGGPATRRCVCVGCSLSLQVD